MEKRLDPICGKSAKPRGPHPGPARLFPAAETYRLFSVREIRSFWQSRESSLK